MTEERLKNYNQILSEQLAELRDEISSIKFMFSMRFNIPPEMVSTPVKMMGGLDVDINHIKRDINELNEDLTLFQDSKEIKKYLRENMTMTRRPVSPVEFTIFDDIDFNDYVQTR